MQWAHHKQLYALTHKDAWDEHKYVARIPTGKKTGNKYRYFYTKEEYQAYLNGKKSEEYKKSKTKKSDDKKKSTAKKSDDKKTPKTTSVQKSSATYQAAITKEAAKRYAKYIYDDESEVKTDSIEINEEYVSFIIYRNGKASCGVEIKRDVFDDDYVKPVEIDMEYGLKKPYRCDYDTREDYIKADAKYSREHSLANNDWQKKADIAANRKPQVNNYHNDFDDYAAYNEAYKTWRYSLADKKMGTDPYQRLSTQKYGEFVDSIKDGYNPFDDMPILGKKESIEDAMYKVNPNYNPIDTNEGYELNCAYCSFTYDLRRRGYDVEARANTEWQNGSGTVVENIWPTIRDKWYNKPGVFTKKYVREEVVPRDDAKKAILANDLTKELEAYGDGARGILCVNWSDMNAGHAIAWEIVGGKLKLIDAQTCDSFEMLGYVNRSTFISYIRTDNLEPSPYVTYMTKTKKKGKSK